MARRVVLIVLGALLLVIGALAAIGGGALMALFGSNDTLSSGVQQVSTPTRALVSEAGSIQGASGAQTAVGSVRLRITATPAGAGHLLFLGIGPASAVDRYLSGVSHDVATDVSVTPFHLTLARQGGTATPPPPGSQSFWVAQASGTHPTLTWTVTSGSYRVVVMNTDATAPVAFTGGLDLTIPHSFAIGIGLLIGGIVLIVIAIVLIVLGARARPGQPPRPVPDPAAGALARPGRTGTSSAGSQRCLRSYMRAVVRPCCCTSCCTDLTLTRQGNPVRLPPAMEALLALVSSSRSQVPVRDTCAAARLTW
jgi:hypothetical protein